MGTVFKNAKINSKRIALILAVLFFVFLNLRPTLAASPPPVASNVIINSGDSAIALTEGTTTNVIVTTTVTDDNGCADLTGVTVKFYKTTTGPDAIDDNNNHYTVTTPTEVVQNSCISLTATYTATIPVYYYADPAEWTALVIPTDGVEGTTDSDTITISTLTALDVSSPVAYGELALGTNTGTTDKTATITNTGNSSIGTQVDGYQGSAGHNPAETALSCTTGTIPIGNERYSTVSARSWSAQKIPLTHTATTVENFNVAQRTDGVSSGDLYFGLGIPANGVGGSCEGVIVFTPI